MRRSHVFALPNAKTDEPGQEVLSKILTKLKFYLAT